MAFPVPQTRLNITMNLAIEVWKSIQWAPIDFDIKAKQLYEMMQGYTGEFQRVQKLPQLIYCASYMVCKAMELEHELLWGTYGYHAMVSRLTLKVQLQNVREATQYMVLPLRYFVAMKLKSIAARILKAVRSGYESRRASTEALAQALQIPRVSNTPAPNNSEQGVRRRTVLSSQNLQQQGPATVLEPAREERFRRFQEQEAMESHQGPPLLPPEVQEAVRESVREELSRIFQAREAREIESGLVVPLPPGEDNSLAPGVGLIVPWEEFDRRLCHAFGFEVIQRGQGYNDVTQDTLQFVIQRIVDRILALHVLALEDTAPTESMADPGLSPPSPLISSASPTPSLSPARSRSRSSTLSSEPEALGGTQSPRQGFIGESTQLRRSFRARRRGTSRSSSPGPGFSAGQPSRHYLRWGEAYVPYRQGRRYRATDSGNS